MQKFLAAAVIVASMGLMGCDRTVSENSKTTTSPNGAQTSTDQKTVEHPDGTVTTSKDVQKTPPANGQ